MFLNMRNTQNKTASQKVKLFYFVGRIRLAWNEIIKELAEWQSLKQLSLKQNQPLYIY
jgi:hypothetical protein